MRSIAMWVAATAVVIGVCGALWADAQSDKEMHIRKQRDYRCDEKEVVLSSGRPDCILFLEDDCQVVEFKPDTYSTSDAESQARRYIDDVVSKFKGDDRAKKCKKDSSGNPIFRPVGVTYTACRP